MGQEEGVGVDIEASVATTAEASEVMMMVAVVGSSAACSWDYLRLFCCG